MSEMNDNFFDLIRSLHNGTLEEDDLRMLLINLVDTPGHLDFSGKVSRALRIADGVVVIVDSVVLACVVECEYN